jgi:hypothetical protein
MAKHFDSCSVMCERNMDIKLSPLDNITDIEFNKGNTLITIGAEGSIFKGLANNEYIGGLLLCNAKQYQEIRKELDQAEAAPMANKEE